MRAKTARALLQEFHPDEYKSYVTLAQLLAHPGQLGISGQGRVRNLLMGYLKLAERADLNRRQERQSRSN